MKSFVRMTCLLAILGVAFIGNVSAQKTKPATSKTVKTKSLYDRLGGKKGISAVVNELWAITSKDTRINRYFAGTKPEVFAGQLTDFLCVGTGGPCTYKGKSMAEAHVGMRISDADFGALAENVKAAMDKLKVPAKEQGEVMTILGGMKGDITNH